MVNGKRAVNRCDHLGVAPYSDTPGGLYRAYLTPAYIAAQRTVAQWMVEVGMTTRTDAAGNLIGRYPGTTDGPPLIIGSHLDSVRDAGRYDGPLGIMLGIECVASLHAAGERMSFPIEVYAFGDEEGSRFPLAMLTSRAVAGVLDVDETEPVDAMGIGLNAALARYGAEAGAPVADDLSGFAAARHPGAIAYLEAHIEQGPLLEAEGLALGTVTAIAAQKRFQISLAGRAGHAGTTSMALRRDALATAAAMILAVEEIARAAGGQNVATVGVLHAAPGAANVIPGSARFTLDVRAATDLECAKLAETIVTRFDVIAAERQIASTVELLHELPASPCHPALMEALDQAIAAEGVPVRRLMSGAGHDAMILSSLCPTAMLFIRCRGGVSHNPAESVTTDDAGLAGNVMLRFIKRLEDMQGA
ncbi:allantoate amidohydrolase [Sphingobium boeckii]|uniref:Allantoate deiminase n=1 Tax=Sphingobium boeckii TaxID=1082345 RepID=A0A7W9AHF6_9SPHN|nr:allantoate amidohydrolase [Sphingobium boeckii]MBB5685709.1 allantoate deiminase [Sphingobium boeckii]